MLRTWLKRLMPPSGASWRPRPAGPWQRRHPYRLTLEALEERCLLSYTITDLGTLGGTFNQALAINSSAQVVGQSFTADNTAVSPACHW